MQVSNCNPTSKQCKLLQERESAMGFTGDKVTPQLKNIKGKIKQGRVNVECQGDRKPSSISSAEHSLETGIQNTSDELKYTVL